MQLNKKENIFVLFCKSSCDSITYQLALWHNMPYYVLNIALSNLIKEASVKYESMYVYTRLIQSTYTDGKTPSLREC